MVFAAWAPAGRAADPSLERGKYLLDAGGCISCHTDLKNQAPLLSGGRAIKTPFGSFYGPNITPSRTYGIGRWTDADFVRAMREGISPNGVHYFPAFPYPTFTKATDRDLLDLKAYIFSLPPADVPRREHEISAPFNWRFLQVFWRLLYFEEGRFDPARSFSPEAVSSDTVGRGAYLVEALTHCGECHTPRTMLGGLDTEMWLAGAADGPEGEAAPNITPDPQTGIGEWSEADIVGFLRSGMNPEGDFAGSLMADVVDHSTGKLTDDDLKAIAAYLKSIPAIRNSIRRSR